MAYLVDTFKVRYRARVLYPYNGTLEGINLHWSKDILGVLGLCVCGGGGGGGFVQMVSACCLDFFSPNLLCFLSELLGGGSVPITKIERNYRVLTYSNHKQSTCKHDV